MADEVRSDEHDWPAESSVGWGNPVKAALFHCASAVVTHIRRGWQYGEGLRIEIRTGVGRPVGVVECSRALNVYSAEQS